MSYPYVQSPEKFVSFLKKLPVIGIPAKFTVKALKSLGFTSSNDERFIPVIKFIGLLDSTGVPTVLWKEMRANAATALAKGLRQGYADLFSQHPNAHQLDDEALRTFFSVHSGLGAAAVARMVSTFKTVSQLSDPNTLAADIVEEASEDAPVRADASSNSRKPRITQTNGSEGMTININIQLQVPADATGEIYEKFFEAMRKHLWPTEE
jgi:hypothetical protein